MDRANGPIVRFRIMSARSTLSTLYVPVLAVLASTLALAGCGGGTPPPDDPTDKADTMAPDEGRETHGSTETEPVADEPKALSYGAKKTTDPGVADDYTLTQKDCVELGKQYVVVQKADQMAQLNPKLSADQKATAEKNIDKVVQPMGDRWADGCISSLVGNVAERKRLECAMRAKTVKAFDDCLNGEMPAE